jgi:hypothetical protein
VERLFAALHKTYFTAPAPEVKGSGEIFIAMQHERRGNQIKDLQGSRGTNFTTK